MDSEKSTSKIRMNDDIGGLEMEELKKILKKFVDSGWDLISVPSQGYLVGEVSRETLLEAVKQADKECGSCGCELDPLYKSCMVLLEEN